MGASLLACLLVGLVAPGDIPANNGWVTDQANVVSAGMEAKLESLMESYHLGTTHEIALLTVPGLEGRSLEGFSLEVARGWGIGGKEANNGALLLVVRDDHKIRIEVGRGLEGTLTDSVSGRIIRDIIAPHFRAGDYDGGLHAGIVAIHAAIGGDYGPLRSTKSARRSSGGGISLLLIALLLFGGMGGRRSGCLVPLFLMGGFGRRRGLGAGPMVWGAGGLGRGGLSGGGFGGFGGGGGFSGGGASGGW